jgi:hypothetical protein
MQATRSKPSLDLNWSRIPRGRRQFYVFALLLLAAVVGNNIHRSMVASEAQDTPVSSARMQNMKSNTELLYH